MTPQDLIDTATNLLQKRYCKEGHHAVVAASVHTMAGRTYTALNVGTNQPSIATCAEIIAIGMAHADDPDMEIDMIVAVRGQEPYVISPCGKCREYIVDYGPRARVIVPADTPSGYELTAATDLIPNKYKKKTTPCA